jgi:hypothetical protein
MPAAERAQNRSGRPEFGVRAPGLAEHASARSSHLGNAMDVQARGWTVLAPRRGGEMVPAARPVLAGLVVYRMTIIATGARMHARSSR